jgi:hypothetical protein
MHAEWVGYSECFLSLSLSDLQLSFFFRKFSKKPGLAAVAHFDFALSRIMSDYPFLLLRFWIIEIQEVYSSISNLLPAITITLL